MTFGWGRVAVPFSEVSPSLCPHCAHNNTAQHSEAVRVPHPLAFSARVGIFALIVEMSGLRHR
jgi:hypothetical protein